MSPVQGEIDHERENDGQRRSDAEAADNSDVSKEERVNQNLGKLWRNLPQILANVHFDSNKISRDSSRYGLSESGSGREDEKKVDSRCLSGYADELVG